MKTLTNAMTTTLQKIEAQANIIVASQKMRDEKVGSLVVIRHGKLMRDQEEEIVGLITETDIIRKAVAQKLDLSATAVDMVMTSPMVTVEGSWPIEDAFDMMKDSGVRHLLVTQNQIVVGLVSLSDLIANRQENLT
jgi:signal-transduction protein with cAMP-binding, CBS, and nucleotidyltransferase domain